MIGAAGSPARTLRLARLVEGELGPLRLGRLWAHEAAERVRAGAIATQGEDAVEQEIERVREAAAPDRPSPAIKKAEQAERKQRLAAWQSALPRRRLSREGFARGGAGSNRVNAA